MTSTLTALLFLAWAAPAWGSAAGATQPAAISNNYSGGYKDDFPQLLTRVQAYVLSVQSDIATQLGLQYGQGFMHPVTVRFEDGRPANSENPFFYVRTTGSNDGFKQDLVANVEAFAKRRDELSRKDDDLRGGFSYALAEVMLNDLAAGDQESALPLWVQEGLAVFASGAGGHFVQTVAERTRKSRAIELVQELNNPGPYLTPRAWAAYYLAIKYIYAQGGLGSLQAFVRDVTAGKSAADAVRNTLSQDWPAFTTGLRQFSANSFAAFAVVDEDDDRPPLGRRPHR